MHRALAALTMMLAGTGCMSAGGHVDRIVDGRVVAGPFVAPEAYAAYLRGAIAEASGDLSGAITSFSEAAARDPKDPEIWSRLAIVRCKRDPRDPVARDDVDRALSLDATFAGAWAADAECAAGRGDKVRAAASARRAADGDVGAVSLERRVAEGAAANDPSADGALRERLVALTLLRAQSPAAWEALAAWATAHGDGGLVARALGHVARQRSDRRGFVATSAVDLAGAGFADAARSLAGELVDVSRDGAWARATPESARVRRLVALLAVDDAVARHAVESARLRSTTMHLGLDEVAARALLAGDAAMARELILPVVEADPRSRSAQLVASAAGAEAPRGVRATRPAADARESAVPFAVFAASVRGAHGRDRTGEAQAAAQSVTAPVDGGDPLVTSIAADLAARGLVRDSQLSADARIELAARQADRAALAALAAADGRGASAAPERTPAPSEAPAADGRHRLLALSFTQPASPATRALAARLAPSAGLDSIVAVALAQLAVGENAVIPPAAQARLELVAPIDALAAATLVAAADRRGDATAAAHARMLLATLAVTDAERALARSAATAGVAPTASASAPR